MLCVDLYIVTLLWEACPRSCGTERQCAASTDLTAHAQSIVLSDSQACGTSFQ